MIFGNISLCFIAARFSFLEFSAETYRDIGFLVLGRREKRASIRQANVTQRHILPHHDEDFLWFKLHVGTDHYLFDWRSCLTMLYAKTNNVFSCLNIPRLGLVQLLKYKYYNCTPLL